MRAVEYDRYGGPEELSVRTVARPEPGAGQALIRVHGTSVNPVDVTIRSGGMKLMAGRRFPKRTGLDFAGEVTELGPGATDVKVGQRVWGFLGDVRGRTGATAEYVAVKISALGPAPARVDLTLAAALPSVGVTALRALRDVLRLASGEELLVVGASGGVGSTAIQIGLAMGARVTAIASAVNRGFCRDHGATRTLDYRNPAAIGGSFDVVLDCHGSDLGRYRRLLRRGGRMMTTASSGMGYAMRSIVTPGPRVRVMMARSRRADLTALAEYVDRGAVQPIVEEIYPLEDIAQAHKLTETGHARGKRVIAVLTSP
ncbi:NADP-dependent oxidoreductase [Nonomuraea sp. NPDC049695]|uniref:NADP-dependent oxidoreductase n=1 Tax=Nonomuraea sp. NPDC049695 TaxID=3154734 RepID=UPI00343059FB